MSQVGQRERLTHQGHEGRIINRALRELDQAAACDDSVAIEAESAE